MDVGTITLVGIPAMVLVLAIVQALKMIGWLDPKYATLASIVAGIVVALVAQFVIAFPGLVPWVTAVVGGLFLGLGASGTWSGVKSLRGFQSVPPGTSVTLPDGTTGVTPTKPAPDEVKPVETPLVPPTPPDAGPNYTVTITRPDGTVMPPATIPPTEPGGDA